MTIRYDAVTSRKDKDGKYWNTRIGSAFPLEKGEGFNIILSALPMPGPDGQARITLFPAKSKDSSTQNAPTATGRPRNEDMNDDEIPFAPEWR